MMWMSLLPEVALILSLNLCLSGANVASNRVNYDIQTPGTGCPPPELSLNQTRVLARRNSTPDFRTFSEVKFTAQFPGPGFTHYSRLCKIKCINERWIGPLCQGEDGEGKYEPILHGCRLGVIPSHLVVTYNNVTLHRVNETIPHHGEIKLRCQEPLGLYKLLGEASIRCNNGKWAADLPLCIPTTSITNFTVESPPTILVRIPSGTAAVDEDTLIVFPGSILHLECLYRRSEGNPQWIWTSEFRQYLTGWAIAAEEREWKYRLSIYYVKLLDSGTFTCTTPRGLSNSVHVEIKGVHCERLSLRSHEMLTTRIEGHRLGQMAHFTCPSGTIREGPANITCMANGQWSGDVPTCQQIICPKIVVENPYLTLVEQNNTYGGHALFQCSWGYQLKGPLDIVCQRNGSWSGLVPECNAVYCPVPDLPLNGHLIEDPTGGPYRVGSILQFACNDRHNLLGEETIVCTERGEWSRAPPRCKARCDYPGEPPNGKIIPLKFFYDPGDHIQVTCNDGYVKPLDISPPGTSGPLCQSDGTWSIQIPHCTNYTDV